MIVGIKQEKPLRLRVVNGHRIRPAMNALPCADYDVFRKRSAKVFAAPHPDFVYAADVSALSIARLGKSQDHVFHRNHAENMHQRTLFPRRGAKAPSPYIPIRTLPRLLFSFPGNAAAPKNRRGRAQNLRVFIQRPSRASRREFPVRRPAAIAADTRRTFRQYRLRP